MDTYLQPDVWNMDKRYVSQKSDLLLKSNMNTNTVKYSCAANTSNS